MIREEYIWLTIFFGAILFVSLSARSSFIEGRSLNLIRFNIGLFLFLIALLTFYNIDVKNIATKRVFVTNVVSLKNENETQGSFTLGSGTIESVEYYYFYTGDSKGYFRDKVPVNKTRIVEADGITEGKLEWIKPIYTSRTGLIDQNSGETDTPKEDSSYVLTIPKGTLVREFKIY